MICAKKRRLCTKKQPTIFLEKEAGLAQADYQFFEIISAQARL
jgi:hypothetical protein